MVRLGVGVLPLRHLFPRRTYLGNMAGDSAVFRSFSDNAESGKRRDAVELDRLRPDMGTCRTNQSLTALGAALSRRMGHLSPASSRSALGRRPCRGGHRVQRGGFPTVPPQLSMLPLTRSLSLHPRTMSAAL